MFDMKGFYSKENNPILARYNQSVIQIKEIMNDTSNPESFGDKSSYMRFINYTANFIINQCEYENVLKNDYFETKNLEELLQENNKRYTEVLPKNYPTSYTNPSYCVELFGDQFGQLFSYFYTLYRNYIVFAFKHEVYKMEEYNSLFINVYNYLRDKEIDYEELKDLMTSVQLKEKSRETYYRFKSEFSKEFRYYTDLIECSDLNDLRYLLRTGQYISQNEIKIAEFLVNYPEEKLNQIAKEIVKAYLKGFKRDFKDVSKKSTIGLVYTVGFEKLYKAVIKEFRAQGLESTIRVVESSSFNKQYQFDHKFDSALYLSKEYNDVFTESYKKGLEKNIDVLAEYSGILALEKFGEKPFSPESKKENLSLSPDQQKLYQELMNSLHMLIDSYTPRAETSFCIIAFPTPDIGDNFEEIFEDTIEINMLDSDKYENIQQKMIVVLDQSESVHVKGMGENKTDLMVKMQPLSNPEKETNFLNSGASVNIPAGEVFTSPQLKGTNGVLHTELAFLRDMRYDNLILTFKDGYIEDYSCTNFDSDDKNQKYIEENLLFPHKTLPLGEFAIGTNTKAYVASRKHNIMEVLPVLILEKTGPHFAVGDTCFFRDEETKKYNQFTNKLIKAVDNEKSILRKTDVNEAYCNKHIDITLAFDSLGIITAIKKNGEKIDIIKDGRFVLKGTEELNEPLES
ncbi:MAG: aminopeptidase [Candidatus Hodarchaeales archaeon]